MPDSAVGKQTSHLSPKRDKGGAPSEDDRANCTTTPLLLAGLRPTLRRDLRESNPQAQYGFCKWCGVCAPEREVYVPQVLVAPLPDFFGRVVRREPCLWGFFQQHHHLQRRAL